MALLFAACPMEDLRVSGNRLGGKGVRSVAEGVGFALTALDVSRNRADAVAGAALGRLLATNSTLLKLDCSWNEVWTSLQNRIYLFQYVTLFG